MEINYEIIRIIQQKEKMRHKTDIREIMNLSYIQNGIVGPMCLSTGLNVAKEVNRLSGLPSTNALQDALLGQDLDIKFTGDLGMEKDEYKTIISAIKD